MFAREAIKLISAGVEFLSSECGGLYTLGFLYNSFAEKNPSKDNWTTMRAKAK